jgi:hypothetical protein
MTVSKRLRFEILRRDNHQCRYCGAAAPEAVLTVDHVKPEALGGTDEAANLVAACMDCNAGKSSTAPDAAFVADVERDAVRWARAMNAAARSMVEEQYVSEQRNAGFSAHWGNWTYGGAMAKPIPLPTNWHVSVDRLRAAGLSDELLHKALEVAMNARGVDIENTFRYFCGVAWRMVGDLQDRARLIVDSTDEDN